MCTCVRERGRAGGRGSEREKREMISHLDFTIDSSGVLVLLLLLSLLLVDTRPLELLVGAVSCCQFSERCGELTNRIVATIRIPIIAYYLYRQQKKAVINSMMIME